ncbi:hypothetical protein AAFC00_007111 [Neodothiora populina]
MPEVKLVPQPLLFHFINVNEDPKVAAQRGRVKREVRQHVMHNHVRKKNCSRQQMQQAQQQQRRRMLGEKQGCDRDAGHRRAAQQQEQQEQQERQERQEQQQQKRRKSQSDNRGVERHDSVVQQLPKEEQARQQYSSGSVTEALTPAASIISTNTNAVDVDGISTSHAADSYLTPLSIASPYSTISTYSENVMMRSTSTQTECSSYAQPPVKQEEMEAAHSVSLTFDPRSLQSHRFDPFACLPLTDLHTDRLAWWHFQNTVHEDAAAAKAAVVRIPAVEHMVKRRMLAYWWIALSDKAHLHGLICLIEAKRAYITGRKDKANYLHHKVQTSALVRKEPQANIRLVVLMSCLVGLALHDEGLDAAQMHMDSIVRLVTEKDALSQIDRTAFRFIVRNDLRLTAARGYDRRPMLPFIHRYPYPESNARIRQVAKHGAQQTMKLLPSHPMYTTTQKAELHDLFIKLHEMTQLCDLDEPAPEDVNALEGVMYWIEYHMSTIFFEQQDHNNNNNKNNNNNTRQASFNPLFTMVLAAQAFANSCMRFPYHTWQSTSQRRILRRLYDSLAMASTPRQCCTPLPLTEEWVAANGSIESLESLLWVLSVAQSVVRRLTGGVKDELAARRLLSQLNDTRAVLQIGDVKSFESFLRRFPWTERFSPKDCEVVWDDMGCFLQGTYL